MLSQQTMEELIQLKNQAPIVGDDPEGRYAPSTSLYPSELETLKAVARNAGYTLIDNMTIDEVIVYMRSLGVSEEVFTEMSRSANGFTYEGDQKNKLIWLRPTLTIDAQLYVLSHELGHAFLPLFYRHQFTAAMNETLAESVSYLVLRELAPGLEAANAVYLRNWAGNPPDSYIREMTPAYLKLASIILASAKQVSSLPLAA
jgi:hypothetical protein